MSGLGPRCVYCRALALTPSPVFEAGPGEFCPNGPGGKHDFKEPELFGESTASGARPPFVGYILSKDDDESQTGPELAADYEPETIEWWIHRVDTTVQEVAQLGAEPLLDKARTIAALYQAAALERIAAPLERIAAALERQSQRATYVPVIQRPRKRAPVDDEMREHIERLPPTAPEYRLRDPATARHPYGATEGSICCSKCGGGPRHEIHQ